MASGSSSSFSRFRSRSIPSSPPPVKCFHDEIAPLRTVKFHGPTLGKRFYGCPYWPRTCGYFKWADEVDEVKELQFMLFEKDTAISELQYEKECLEESVKKLKENNSKLEDDVNELALENAVKFESMESVKADKKLVFAMLLSWIFFAVVLLIK
ncbi:DNA topoisomerase 3-alpha [Bienertia sinuspersici]